MLWPFQITRLLLAAITLMMALALLSSLSFGQAEPQFDVASVKPSLRRVGPDYNNRFAFLAAGIAARNVTIERLVAETYHVQLNQVLGPDWLDQNEYDLDARAGSPVSKEQLVLMLRSLLAERFQLRLHRETRNMRAYELVIAKGGPKIQPLKDGQVPSQGPGLAFHGNMRQLADLVALQLTLPPLSGDPSQPALAGGPPVLVLDKTGLSGTYDFCVDITPEPGTDGFTTWQRVLQYQLGLKLENNRRDIPVVVLDAATPIPTGN